MELTSSAADNNVVTIHNSPELTSSAADNNVVRTNDAVLVRVRTYEHSISLSRISRARRPFIQRSYVLLGTINSPAAFPPAYRQACHQFDSSKHYATPSNYSANSAASRQRHLIAGSLARHAIPRRSHGPLVPRRAVRQAQAAGREPAEAEEGRRSSGKKTHRRLQRPCPLWLPCSGSEMLAKECLDVMAIVSM